jgi:sulfoxide reductase heme-binding subunit YedZ
LLVGLAITPLRRLTGWNRIIKVRRTVGLFAFFYVSLHFFLYLGLDQGFAWSFILEDVTDRPFITSGFFGFLLLVPLAVTSTKGWIRRLGRRWQKLHRLVYVAAGLGVLHFYWKVKADTFWPLVAAVVLAALLLARVRWRRRPKTSA